MLLVMTHAKRGPFTGKAARNSAYSQRGGYAVRRAARMDEDSHLEILATTTVTCGAF